MIQAKWLPPLPLPSWLSLMSKQNILLESLKESFEVMWKYRFVILVIFIIQLVFFAGIIVNSASTLTPAIRATTEIMVYMSGLNVSETALAENVLIGKSMFGNDPLMIYRNSQTIFTFLGWFVLIFFVLFVVLEGIIWTLTVHLSKRRKAIAFFHSMLNFTIIAVAYFVLLFLIVYLFVNSIAQNSYAVPLIFFIILNYVVLIAFSLVHLKNYREILKKTFEIAAYKSFIVIPLFLVALILVALASFFLYASSDMSLLSMFAAIVVFIITYVFTRILIVKTIHNLV